MTGYQVAAKLHISKSAVYKRIHSGKKMPHWTDEENQIMVDGYAERLPVREIAKKLPGRSPRAIMVAMCRYRKKVRADAKKRLAIKMIGKALKAVRKADIFREVEGDV